MPNWINVSKQLPKEDEFVKVKVRICILFKEEKEALYCCGVFNCKGENISKWVTHWMPSEEIHNEV